MLWIQKEKYKFLSVCYDIYFLSIKGETILPLILFLVIGLKNPRHFHINMIQLLTFFRLYVLDWFCLWFNRAPSKCNYFFKLSLFHSLLISVSRFKFMMIFHHILLNDDSFIVTSLNILMKSHRILMLFQAT